MKAHLIILLLLTVTSCSSENSQSKSIGTEQSGSFNLELSNDKIFTHQDKKFKIVNVTSDYFEFKASSWQTRFSAIKLSETAPSSSTDLVYNNTFVSFYQDVKGKRTKIMCKPANEPVGKISILSLDNNVFSGEFEFTLTKCNDFYSGGAIEGMQLPMTAKGSFNGLSYKNHLNKLMNKK